jgi:hypothetical protein
MPARPSWSSRACNSRRRVGPDGSGRGRQDARSYVCVMVGRVLLAEGSPKLGRWQLLSTLRCLCSRQLRMYALRAPSRCRIRSPSCRLPARRSLASTSSPPETFLAPAGAACHFLGCFAAHTVYSRSISRLSLHGSSDTGRTDQLCRGDHPARHSPTWRRLPSDHTLGKTSIR